MQEIEHPGELPELHKRAMGELGLNDPAIFAEMVEFSPWIKQALKEDKTPRQFLVDWLSERAVSTKVVEENADSLLANLEIMMGDDENIYIGVSDGVNSDWLTLLRLPYGDGRQELVSKDMEHVEMVMELNHSLNDGFVARSVAVREVNERYETYLQAVYKSLGITDDLGGIRLICDSVMMAEYYIEEGKKSVVILNGLTATALFATLLITGLTNSFDVENETFYAKIGMIAALLLVVPFLRISFHSNKSYKEGFDRIAEALAGLNRTVTI